jgi:anhydro-N-acetylmuramic acid kinase
LPPKDDKESKIISFDNGPGNMIIDEMMRILTKNKFEYDKDGEFAKNGKVNEELLNILLNNEYFDKSPPKTTVKKLIKLGKGVIWETIYPKYFRKILFE